MPLNIEPEEITHTNKYIKKLNLSTNDDVYLYYNVYYMYNIDHDTLDNPNKVKYENISAFSNGLKDSLLDADIQYKIDTFNMIFDEDESNVDMLSQSLVNRTGIIDGEPTRNETKTSPKLKFISYTFLQNDKDHTSWEDVPVFFIIMSSCNDSNTYNKMDNLIAAMINNAEWTN